MRRVKFVWILRPPIREIIDPIRKVREKPFARINAAVPFITRQNTKLVEFVRINRRAVSILADLDVETEPECIRLELRQFFPEELQGLAEAHGFDIESREVIGDEIFLGFRTRLDS